MQMYDSVERDGDIIRTVAVCGKESWLTLEEAVEIRDKLSACLMDVDAKLVAEG